MPAFVRISTMQLLLAGLTAALLAPRSVWAQDLPNLDIRRCSFPPKGGNSSSVVLPTDGCPREPETNATLAAAKANAWKFAPNLHMHPLELYHLQDPGVFWDAATLVDAFNQNKDPNDTLAASGQSFSDYYLLSRSFITINNATDKRTILAGAPITQGGLSTAKVYFSVFDLDERYWVYNYNLFYSFNGCSNQILSLAINGSYVDSRYILCPAGIHEGDWERVSVLVCKSQQRARRVVLSQHGWNQHLNCDEGECTFNGTNPVVYAALNSHANYPAASPAWVYAEVRLDFLPNLDGVFIVDRTLTGPLPGVRFKPTPDNIVYLNTDPNVASGTDLWGIYLGTWGAPLAKQPFTLTCLTTNQTSYVPCARNAAYAKLQQGIGLVGGSAPGAGGAAGGISSGDGDGTAIGWNPLGGSNSTAAGSDATVGSNLTNANATAAGGTDNTSPNASSANSTSNSTVLGNAGNQLIATSVTKVYSSDGVSPKGPITKDYTYFWSPPASSALWSPQSGILGALQNKTVPPVCPASGNPLLSFRVPVNWKNDDLSQYLIGIVVGVLAFAVLMTLLLMLPPIIWPKIAKINLVPTASTADPDREALGSGDRLKALITPVEHILRVCWVTLGFLLYVGGAVLVGVGCQSLWDTLQNLLSIGLWDTLRSIFIALLVVVGVFDLIFAVILATLHPLECCRFFPHRSIKSKAANAPKRGNVTSALITGCILIVVSVVILLFAFGVTITVFRKIFAKACRTVVSKAEGVVGGDNYCLNLTQFGLDRTYCLTDVATFCNRWETLKVNYIVLGAVLMLWAHTLFLLLVARNFALTREYRLRHTEWGVASGYGERSSRAANAAPAAKVMDRDSDEN